MADFKVRQLDNRVAGAIRTRAERRGVSFEEEVRATLTDAVDVRRQAFARRAAACRRAAGHREGKRTLDSARLTRQDRDDRG
jgi:plasmid stability protein